MTRRGLGMSLGLYVLDEHGNPAPCDDVLTWGRWYEGASRHLKIDEVGPLVVSTVFLGLDHRFGDGPPVLWETMTFMVDRDDPDATEWYEQERYTSREDAYEGHARAVKAARERWAKSKAIKVGGRVKKEVDDG